MDTMNIDTGQIPLHVRDQLAYSFLRAAETFFATAENQAAYEKWLAARKRREEETIWTPNA